MTTGHRQRLRERFLAQEESALTEEALLELLLTYAIPQRDVRPLAQSLLDTFGSLAAVFCANHEDLLRVKGIQTASAALLQLVHQLHNQVLRQTAGELGLLPRDDASVSSAGEQHIQTEFPALLGQAEASAPATMRERSGLFSKALLKEAIALLPTLPDTSSLPEIKRFLSQHLRFNAEQTRSRYANYITSRMFPGGEADAPLRRFARAFAGRRELNEVCFYRFITAEPLMQEVIDALLLPQIGRGQIPRQTLKTYLSDRFPHRSTQECYSAMTEAFRAADIARIDKTTMAFNYREINIPAFAFVLHSEFPRPGMYDIAALEQNRPIRAMLWNPDRLLTALYELRNQGLISKVSEIDSVRQFTTRWTLNELVEHL